MKIGGYGEFENIQKTTRKDSSSRLTSTESETSSNSSAERSDAVQISSQAKVMGKLQQVSDVRQEKIQAVMEKIESGELMTEDAVKEGISGMLESLL